MCKEESHKSAILYLDLWCNTMDSLRNRGPYRSFQLQLGSTPGNPLRLFVSDCVESAGQISDTSSRRR